MYPSEIFNGDFVKVLDIRWHSTVVFIDNQNPRNGDSDIFYLLWTFFLTFSMLAFLICWLFYLLCCFFLCVFVLLVLLGLFYLFCNCRLYFVLVCLSYQITLRDCTTLLITFKLNAVECLLVFLARWISSLPPAWIPTFPHLPFSPPVCTLLCIYVLSFRANFIFIHVLPKMESIVVHKIKIHHYFSYLYEQNDWHFRITLPYTMSCQ